MHLFEERMEARMKKKLMILLLAVSLAVQSLPVSATELSGDQEQEVTTDAPGNLEDLDETESDEVTGSESTEVETEVEVDDSEQLVEESGEVTGVFQEGALEPDTSEEENFSVQRAVSSKKQAMDYLYEQMKARQENIDVSGYKIPIKEINSVLSATLNSHPDLYAVSSGGLRYYHYPSASFVDSITVKYLDTDDAAFENAVDEALAEVTPEMTDLEKIVVLHDYLDVHTEYDYENYKNNTLPRVSYTAYGVLVEKKAVCQGYMLAYQYLLNKCGITSYYVTSTEMNHAWNIVKLDGMYYHIDATWDDPVPDTQGMAMHQYLLTSDGALAGHYDWHVYSTEDVDELTVSCSDTRYDTMFWREILSPVIAYDGVFLYRNGYQMMQRTSLPNGEETVWCALPKEDELASDWWTYRAIANIWNDRIYYITGHYVASCELDGSDQQIHYHSADSIYGFYIYGGTAKITYQNKTEEIELENVIDPDQRLTAPVFSIISDTVDENEQLELSAQEGTTIYYTVDGSTPTIGSTEYTTPISLTEDMIVKAYAVKEGFYSSKVVKHSYQVCTNRLVFSEDAVQLTVHDSYTIQMKELPTTRTLSDVTFTSSDSERLSVDGTAVTALKPGEVTVTASVEDHKGRTVEAECQITILPKMYTVTFLGFDGQVEEISEVEEYEDAVIPQIELPEGYRLTGWDQDGRSVQSNLTIRALYEPVMYQITYETNGGELRTDIPTQYTIESRTIDLPNPLPRDGYRFEGWFDDEACEGTRVTQITGGSTGDRYFYAKWISRRGLWIGKKGEGPEQEIPEKPIADKIYTGTKIIPDDYVVYDGDTELVEGKDYTVTVSNNVKVNLMETEQELKKCPTITIKGKGNYSGKVTANFVIRPVQTIAAPVSIKKVKVDKLETCTYTGESICPRPKVTTADGTVLTEGEDYFLSWSNNTQAGTGTVQITGIHGYTGTRKVTFKILPFDLTTADANGSAELTFTSGETEYAYEKGGAKPTVKVTYTCKGADGAHTIVLQEGVDYTVKYLNNSRLTEQQNGKPPEVVITGKKNFKNKKSLTFTLKKKNLSEVKMEAADVGESTKPGKYMSKLVLTDTNGKPLTTADYDSRNLIYQDENGEILGKQDQPEAGDVITVTASGKGFYEGLVSTTYRICATGKHLGKASVTLRDSKEKKYYTGEKITLDKTELKVRIGKVELTSDEFELINYKNNKDKGTAQVTVRGKGEYAGTKVFKFKIEAQSMKWWKLNK